MAYLKMMQGDSYAVFFSLRIKETSEQITPDMVSEVEVTVGKSLRKTYTAGEVRYDNEQNQWYFVPTQDETFAMEPESYEVQVRPKLSNGQYSTVKGITVGNIVIQGANSNEVI
jgi:hypothetical protein